VKSGVIPASGIRVRSVRAPGATFFPIGHRGLTWCIPYGYNSHRSRLGRDNRRKLFRKTRVANDVVGALHPVVDRSDSDTGDLFTFLTLARLGPRLGRLEQYGTSANAD
jgi:hypothetical protein